MTVFTLADAEAAGWTVAVDGQTGAATRGDERIDVTSGIPLFCLLANIAECEGQPFAAGYGGDQPITSDLVQQTSGETYAAPAPPPPPVATAMDHALASDALISETLAATGITVDQLPTELETLLGEASQAIPFFEKYALDPSMTAKQWTDFQALPQQTKDRLLYDTLRTVAALLRYLTGDLPTGAAS